MPTKKNNIPTRGFIRKQDAARKQEILDLFIKETNEYGAPNYNSTTDFPSPIYEDSYQQALDYQTEMLNSPRGQEMLRQETARNFLFNRDKRNERAFQETYDARLRNLENARNSLLFAPEISDIAYGMAFPDGENTVVLTQELRGIPYTVPNMYNPDDLMFTMVHEADHVEKGSDYNREGFNFFDANLRPKAFEKVRLTQRKTKDALENLDAQFGGGYQRQTGMTKEDFLSNYKNKKKGEKAYYFGEKNPDKNVEGHIPLVELYDFDWATSPDEVSSQIVELQFLSSRAGVYDPKTEEFNESHLKKLEQLVNSKQVPQTVFRTFKNLKGIYEDDKLIDIMNLISQDNSTTDQTNMTYAQNGGYSRHQEQFIVNPDGETTPLTDRGFYYNRALGSNVGGQSAYSAPSPGGGGFLGSATKDMTQADVVRQNIVKDEVEAQIDRDNQRQREIDRGTLPAYSFNKRYGKDTETLNGYAPGTPGHTFAMYGQDIKLYSYGDNTAEENRQLVDELEQIFRENGLGYSEELNQSLQAFRDKTYHNYLVKNKDVLDGYYAQVKDYDNLLAAQSAPGVDNTRMEARMLDAFRPEFPLEAQRNPVVIKKSPLSAVHNTLAVTGMVPVIGEPLDLLDAALYTLEGDYGGAALAGASVVPFMGSGAGALRLTGAAKTLAKGAEEGSDLNRYIKQIERERRMYASPGASQEGFDYLRYSEQFPQLSKESEYLSNLGFYNINRKTGAQAVDDYTSSHHLAMNTAFDNLNFPNQKRASALNELVLDNSKRMANDLDDFISSGIGGRTSKPITLSRASTDEVVRVVNADNSITVKKFSELQPNDVILETKFTSYYDPNRPLFNQNMFNKTADDYGLGYFPVRQQTYIPQGTKLGVPTFHGNAKMFQDEAEFIGNRFGVRRFTGMNPDGSYGFQLIGGFQDGGSVSGEEPVSDNAMDNVEESIDYSQYNTDILIMASKFSMSPDEYIEYYNKGIQMLNAGNTIDDLVNMGYGNKEALLSMFPGASVESRGKSQTLQQEIKHIPVTNLLADTDSRTDVSKVGADMIEFVNNGQTSESTTLKMQSGGIFENPITSAMEKMDEFGNMIVNQNLKNALGETVEDTFGFNFLPDDSNCEVEVIYKAQEGGYSMNQDNVVEQLVEGVGAGAGKIYDFISGMGDRAEDIIEISKNPNYVNQNQPFLNRALDAFKLYLSGQPAVGEDTPAPVKTERGENADSPVALTPAKINANNITAAIEQVAKDDENLATLLAMTAYMENSYGANPNAYGREYTHSFMSLDDPSLNQIFDIRTGATDYTKGQKAIFNMFESLGLPSDKESFTELLDKDDPLASVAASRAYYATVPEALPASSDTEGLFNYFSKYYNRGGQGKYQTEEESLNRFLEGYTRLVEQEDFANGGTVGETGKILVSSNGVFDRNYEPGKPVIVPTRNGVITMDGVDEDLLAISNLGEFRFMDADSGNYQFEGKTVLEVPVKMFYGKDGGLADWFKEEWVRIDTEGNITGPCGTMKKGKATTRCLPKKKAQSLSKAERKATARKKVRGSKKGKQFVANTKKAKVTRKDTKRYEEGGQAPLSESFVMVDVSKMDTPRENKSFTFADNLSQYSTATAASKALNANDIRDFLKSEGYDVSLTDGKTLSSDELSALNTYMTGQQSVMLDGGELPYQTFTRVTGLPWPEAKRRGFTDGSYEKNIALQNMLLEGKTLGTTVKPENRRSFAEEEGLVEINIR